MFVVNLEEGTTYEFRVLGADSDGGTNPDPDLYVYDEAGNELAYDWDTFGYDPFVNLVAEYTGDHYLAVERYNDPGTYTVQVQEGEPQIDDHLNDFTTTSRLALGEPTVGDLEYFDEADMFVVNLEEGTTYEFKVLGADSGGGTLPDPDLYVYDDVGNQLAYNYDTFGYDPYLSLVAGYDGDHYLAVERYGNPGTYTVQVQEGEPQIDDHLNDFTTTSRLVLGEQTVGEVEFFDQIDMFVVRLEEGTTYGLSVLGADSGGGTLPDPDLYVYDDVGNQLAYNYDTFGYDPYVSLVAGYTGDHYLAVERWGDPGTYAVEVQSLIDDHANDFTTTSRLALGERMSGDLEFFDTIDMFVVDLEKGGAYEFRVLGSESNGGTLADPTLAIYDSNENWLDYNDDFFGYDPFIGFFVAGYDGDHYLAIEGYGDAGTYTVLAQEGDIV